MGVSLMMIAQMCLTDDDDGGWWYAGDDICIVRNMGVA